MTVYRIMNITQAPEKKEELAAWFHSKWSVPLEAYRESIEESLNGKSAVPSWYMCLDGEKIIAGMGVIENDFHDRKDLAPNICAVYTDKKYRGQGIAGEMLSFVCKDMKSKGIDTLYLVTDHIGFYERYGWEFYCMVQGDGEENMTRLYIHRER